MSLVTVMKVSLNFFERQIFNQIGLQVNPGDRIGLVGRNGSGKTTLLRIIKGEIAPESGEVRIAKKARIGYLPQDVHETVSGFLLQSLLESIPGRTDLKNRLNDAEHSLKTDPDKENQVRSGEKIAAIHQDLNRLDLEFPHHEAEKFYSASVSRPRILTGLFPL